MNQRLSRPAHPDVIASDDELAERIRSGDAEAMNEVLRRYWSGVVEYVAQYMHNGDDAKDVAQDTFLCFWHGRVVWKRVGSLKSFLYGVARNLARNRGRSWQQARIIPLDRDTIGTTASLARGPDEVVETSELLVQLDRAIAALPPRRHEIFTLARVHELSHAEIAAVLGISVQTVANQMSAALTDLRHRLAPLRSEPR